MTDTPNISSLMELGAIPVLPPKPPSFEYGTSLFRIMKMQKLEVVEGTEEQRKAFQLEGAWLHPDNVRKAIGELPASCMSCGAVMLTGGDIMAYNLWPLIRALLDHQYVVRIEASYTNQPNEALMQGLRTLETFDEVMFDLQIHDYTSITADGLAKWRSIPCIVTAFTKIDSALALQTFQAYLEAQVFDTYVPVIIEKGVDSEFENELLANPRVHLGYNKPNNSR